MSGAKDSVGNSLYRLVDAFKFLTMIPEPIGREQLHPDQNGGGHGA